MFKQRPSVFISGLDICRVYSSPRLHAWSSRSPPSAPEGSTDGGQDLGSSQTRLDNTCLATADFWAVQDSNVTSVQQRGCWHYVVRIYIFLKEQGIVRTAQCKWIPGTDHRHCWISMLACRQCTPRTAQAISHCGPSHSWHRVRTPCQHPVASAWPDLCCLMTLFTSAAE